MALGDFASAQCANRGKGLKICPLRAYYMDKLLNTEKQLLTTEITQSIEKQILKLKTDKEPFSKTQANNLKRQFVLFQGTSQIPFTGYL